MSNKPVILNLLAAVCAALAVLACTAGQPARDTVLLDENFSDLPVGLFSVPVGPHTEYHYLKEAAPKGAWAVTAFTWEPGSQRAWQVLDENGSHVMAQTFTNREMTHTHPMIVSGDSLWRDYDLSVSLAADSLRGQAGVVFRYRNDRCYYFFGLDSGRVLLKAVRHATAFHKPYERILAAVPFAWQAGQYYDFSIRLAGDDISASLAGGPTFSVRDSTFRTGKVALTSDIPTRFRSVKVTCAAEEKSRIDSLKAVETRVLADLQAANPKPVLWKKLSTAGFGVGRNLRFGDLDGDGQVDVLVGQLVHHAWPSDSYSELSCLTALTFDGKVLWQVGHPDPANNHLTNDVAFQVHDLDGDGKNEVVYTMNMELIVADGATGRTKYKAPTPKSLSPADSFPNILGDCLYFCDLRGKGRDSDIIIKDRYWHLWTLDDHLHELWRGECKTGHYPYAFDMDGDGRDELFMGYSLFDDDGRKLWSLDSLVQDHADGVAVLDFGCGAGPEYFCAASDEGSFRADLEGHITGHNWIGHCQNPAVADFLPEMPGLETVSINFWGNQGIIHFYDCKGQIYRDFEPMQYGSMCLPVNWTGAPGEYFVLNASVAEGGMYDGWGQRVVVFPDDGHPEMCNAVLDLTGDCRDEVVVWDPNEIWVYTQDDNPRSGRLYQPVRNPLYNYSNYQATVSLPHWNE